MTRLDLGAYIELLERARERKRAALSQEDLREIVADLGWTDDDFAVIETEVQAHVERAHNFAAHGLWDKAIAELRQGGALAPNRFGIWADLSSAYYGRFKDSQDFADLLEVEEFANRCLELQPSHHAAYALLAEAQRTRGLSKREMLKQRKGYLIAVILVLLVAIAIGAYALMKPVAVLETPVTVVPHEVEYLVPEEIEQVIAPAVPEGEVDLEVIFDVDPAVGVTLVPKRAKQNNYDSGSFFKYAMLLDNTGKNEISKLDGRVELLDEDQTVVAVSELGFLGSHHGTLRPGDQHPLSSTLRSKPEVKSARFQIKNAEYLPAPPIYADPIPVALIWDIPQPPSVKIELFERLLKVDNLDKSLGGLGFFKAEWELRNVGEQTLKALKLEYRLMDKDDKQMDSTTTIVAYSGTPEISPGENRVVFGIKQLKSKGFERYEIHVIEAE